MSKELNELTEQRYGLSNNGHEYYKFIDAVLVAVINELERINPKDSRVNYLSIELPGTKDELKEYHNNKRLLGLMDKPFIVTDEQLDYANKRLDEQIVSWGNEDMVHPPVIKNTYNFGNCVNCTNCKGERTEQDVLQVVADKIKAGHEVMEKVKDDLMLLGTGIMFIDEKGNAKRIKLDDVFFEELVDEFGIRKFII